MLNERTKRIILKVSVMGILANAVLFALRLTLGLIFGNMAVLSDALHTGADLLTAPFVIAAAFLSSPKIDKGHHYGHEKTEPLISLFLSLIIASVGGVLLWQGIAGVISPHAAEFNWYLVGVTVLTIATKECLFWYGIKNAKKIRSDTLKADAWHSRADALSSVAVLIGLIASNFMHTNIVESIAVLVVSLAIFRVAYKILKPAIRQLTDTAASQEDYDKIKAIAHNVSGVKGIESIRTRLFGNKIFADIVIEVDGSLPLNDAHKIAQQVHDNVEAYQNLRVKHCLVSMVPKTEALEAEVNLEKNE